MAGGILKLEWSTTQGARVNARPYHVPHALVVHDVPARKVTQVVEPAEPLN